MIDRYGLRQNCVGVVTMPDLETGWLPDTLRKPPTTVRTTIDHLTTPARELIGRGAEAIVIGCGLTNAWLSSLMTLDILSEEYPGGFWQIEGVPIVDVFGSATKTAELLARWKQQGRPFVSRAGAYANVSATALTLGQDTLKAFGSKYWDC
jgi:Asp/Glu/hydantoin racemase